MKSWHTAERIPEAWDRAAQCRGWVEAAPYFLVSFTTGSSCGNRWTTRDQ